MKFILIVLSTLFIQTEALADAVYKCKQADRYHYQDTPCQEGSVVQKLTPKITPPDPATLERLEQQRLDYLKKTNPAEYYRLRRQKLPLAEQLADERAEQQQRLQQDKVAQELRQRELHQRALLREMEAQRLQTQQVEQQRRDMEQQRLLQERVIVIPRQHSHPGRFTPSPRALVPPSSRPLTDNPKTLRPY